MQAHCAVCGHEIDECWHESDSKTERLLMMGMCPRCGLVQQLFQPTRESLNEYYRKEYRLDYKETYTPKSKHVYRALNVAKDRLGFMARAGLRSTGASLLDVGCGGGEFCAVAGEMGIKAKGVDLNEGYANYAKAELGVDVMTGSIDDVLGQEYDVITMFHVLEHLPSPEATVRSLWYRLKTTGHVVIEVPNIHQNDASPHNIYFKAHLHYFSHSSLRCVMSRYFYPVYWEDEGNLKAVFKKRAEPREELVYPEAAELQTTRQRLKEKGWVEYLFAGGGLQKPFRKLTNSVDELRVRQMRPAELLKLTMAMSN
jgi:2-polyprenyl-3-methyl-5-hydroxy-6-metoxy-1,4-benzoquinol methylase